MSLEIDHVVLCVQDLQEAGDEVRRRYGLRSSPGGRHVGHGTANRIVPLDAAYLELVAVRDPDEASASPFGRWVTSRATEILTPDALCLRTDDLDAICDRLGIDPISMSRAKPDGTELRWRLAGLEEMVVRGLPFFIEWDISPSDYPGSSDIDLDASLEATLTGDPDVLANWTAGSSGIRLESGEPGVGTVIIRLDGRSFQL